MADCTNCGSRLYPDQRTLCGHCRTRQMVREMQSDHFADDDVMLPVGTERMSIGQTLICAAITLAVMLLFGWLLGEGVPG